MPFLQKSWVQIVLKKLLKSCWNGQLLDPVMLQFISNFAHYKEVLSRVQSVKHLLWIGTADIKDMYIDVGKEKKPFLALIAQLIRRGVEVRLIHAKEPGPNFREDFDKYPVLYDRLERVLCPRVHFKMLVFDGKEVYVGSANLTGAGIGMMRNPPHIRSIGLGYRFFSARYPFTGWTD